MHPLSIIDASFSYSGGGPGETARARKGFSLAGFSLTIDNGELTALIGPNGSGKSTTLKLASGILTPESGEALLWGRPVGTYSGSERARLLSYMPQTLHAAIPFTVIELAEMGLYPYSVAPSLTPERALDIVGLASKADCPLYELSGGEKRRAYVAMMLVQGAGVLLLDEPLANLDIKYQQGLIELLRKIVSTGEASVVMALHDIPVALHFDRVVVLRDGAVFADGPPREVLTPELLSEVFGVDVEGFYGLRLPGTQG